MTFEASIDRVAGFLVVFAGAFTVRLRVLRLICDTVREFPAVIWFEGTFSPFSPFIIAFARLTESRDHCF
jgi:hypothetical protein